MIWITVLLVFNLLAAGAITTVLVRQRETLSRLQKEVETLVGESDPTLPRTGTAGVSPLPGEHITIQLLNPMQLAAKQSRFADRFGTLTPSLVRRIVYQKAAVIVRQQLLEYGAEADVTVHRGV